MNYAVVCTVQGSTPVPRSTVASRRAHVALGALGAAQWAKFTKKVHKPPLRINVINFELDGFKMHQYGSLGVPQTPKSCDVLIEVFKFIKRWSVAESFTFFENHVYSH